MALLTILARYMAFHEYVPVPPERRELISWRSGHVEYAEKWRKLAHPPRIICSSTIHPKILKPFR